MQPVNETLHSLILSNIDLNVFPVDTLYDLLHLRILDMSGNELETLPADSFKFNSELSLVGLSGNRLQTLHASTFNHLQYLRQLTFDNNNFYCGSELRAFRDYVHDNMHDIYFSNEHCSCSCSRQSVYRFTVAAYSTLWYECDHVLDIVIAVAVCICIGMLLLIVKAMYNRRYDILYWWIIGRHRKEPPPQPPHEYERLNDEHFDAFISYSNDDLETALVIHKELEHGTDVQFNVAIDKRDFIPGNYIAQNIADLISKSDKTILLISSAFLASGWTEYEM